MNNENYIKFALLQDKQVFGIWSIVNNPGFVEIAGNGGLEFIILDLEHGIIDIPLIENSIRACEVSKTSALVRVPSHDSCLIQTVIDLGAHGVIAPQIKNFKEAEKFIHNTKLFPKGMRGFNPFTRAGGYNPGIPIEFTKLNNDFLLTSIIIENKHILKDLDLILNLNNLDLLYIGIYDLSIDMGMLGDTTDSQLQKLVLSLIETIKKSKKFVGLMVRDIEEMKQYSNYGVDVFVVGVDTYLFYSCIKNKVDAFKSIAENCI